VHLGVGERRPDGYHLLDSIFLCLDFGDSLFVEEGERGGAIEAVLEPEGGADIPAAENLACRAAALFRESSGYDRALRIRIVKRIPLGGGLGGGSSDAAAVLRALNLLSGAAYSRRGLALMAERLGSDVPFFLSGGAALVSGRGERIRPLPPGSLLGASGEKPSASPRASPLGFLLVNPGFPSSTAAAFAQLDAHRAGPGAGAVKRGVSVEDAAESLAGDPARWPYSNDFLPVFRAAGAADGVYDRILDDLKAQGAVFSGLSGAGSSCFGVFPHKGAILEAENTLKRHWPFVQPMFFLASMPPPVLLCYQ
jgi:4-diphosphocytidyl-2-C-methyl-D-erythritol kinase